MNTIQTIFAAVEQHAGLLLVSLAVWATVVLGVAWLMAARMRRAAPSVRYCVWQFALTGLLGVPLVFVALPGIPLGMKLPTVASESSPPVPNQKAALAASSTGRLRLPVAHEPARTSPPNFAGATGPSDRSQNPTAESRKLKSKSAAQSVPANNAATVPSATNPGTGASAGQRLQFWLLSIWFLGAAIQAIWLLVAAARAWKLARRAVSLHDERFRKSLSKLQQRLGICRRVSVRSTERVCIPVVVGAVRPTILLPANCWEWSDERIRMALAHELAHVERRDVFWQITARVAAAIYWFHPLVWLAVRRMRQERERACDDRVLSSGVEATDYASGLVEVAAALRGRRLRMPVAVGMAHSSHLEDRVRSILNPSQSRGPISRRLRRVILLATAAVVLALGVLRPFSPFRTRAAGPNAAGDSAVASATAQAMKESPPKSRDNATDSKLDLDKNRNQLTTGKIHVVILDESGNALRNVKVFVNALASTQYSGTAQRTTLHVDSPVVIPLPKRIDLLQLQFSKAGCVFQQRLWGEDGRDGTKIPSQCTIRLQTGSVMGGTIVDESYRPIPGVKVTVMSEANGSDKLESWWPADGDLMTDVNGHWRLDTVPPGDHPNMTVSASHPDFISLGQREPQPIERLRGQTAVTILSRGIRVAGRVSTSKGKPFDGALVVWGDSIDRRLANQIVQSDKLGQYRLPPLPAGPMQLTLIAKGWMPETRNIQITAANPPEDFQLKPGKTLRVRLVDRFGKPVIHARFDIEEWRGAKSLYNREYSSEINSKIPVFVNKQGVYEWTWAPDDGVKFFVSAVGDLCAQEATFTADNKEHVFVLTPPLRITGHVSDAITGRPIDRFTIIPVRALDEARDWFYVDRQEAKEFRGGSYSLPERDARYTSAYRVRVEADGYRAAMSGTFHFGDSRTTCDFKLAPGVLNGRVLAGGKPIQGAKAYLATKTQEYESRDTDESSFTTNYHTVTDQSGEFRFPAQFERYTLVAVHDDGYAEVTHPPDQSPGDLVLQPWASVEGRLFQAGEPAKDLWVQIEPIDSPKRADTPQIDDRQFAQTDGNGFFKFGRVHAGKFVAFAQLSPFQTLPITSSPRVPLDLQPGDHATLNLGGDGISVTGHVVLHGGPKGIDLNWSRNYLLRMKPGIAPPSDISATRFDWRLGWTNAWDDTQEGREYLDTLFNDFVRIHSDGKLLINGVSAGDYQLALRIYKHDDPKACLTEPIAERVVKFTVTPADIAKGSLNLGTIEVEAMRVPQPGEIVPDFEFATLDGPAKKLSEFRGKYVLADFWATWCGECVAALPNVHHLEEKYGSDGRFVVVPISLDDDLNALRRFVADRKLQGIQGSLGDWSKTNLPARLGVSSLPTYLLIGPDGKLIVNAWSVDQVSGKLSGVLKSAAAR